MAYPQAPDEMDIYIAICTFPQNFSQHLIPNGLFGSNTPTSNNTNTGEIYLFS
jgi:hypothetical protein